MGVFGNGGSSFVVNATAETERAGAQRGWRRWLVEPARPAAIARYPNAHWLVLATVCMGAFIGQLDASIVILAFPTLQDVFHASVSAVTWVGLSYLLVLVATVTAIGRFADMVGRKLLYAYGFLVFVIGSALCGLAPSLGALDAFRALQAVGAAMLQANSVAIIYLAMPRGSLGRGIGIQGAAQAMGLALGPAVGGFLLAAGGWRLIFLVNVPIGLVGMVAAWVFIPRSRNLQPRLPFDWVGFGLFVPAVLALLGGLSFGNRIGWNSPLIIGLLATAVVLGVVFTAWERRCASPMVDISLFRRIPFSAGISSGLLSYLVMFGVLFAVPFFLERAQHLSSSQVGLQLTVMPLALGITAPFAGRLADRFGARPLTVAGMALTACVLGSMAFAWGTSWVLIGELALIGVGLGLFIPPNNASIMASAPREQSGLAGGILNMTRGLGTAFGLALTAAVYEVAAGAGASPVDAATGFRASAAFLACVAVVAMALAGLRGARVLEMPTVIGSSE
jgi:EmrB/QacA subfamily drug resistance transporter